MVMGWGQARLVGDTATMEGLLLLTALCPRDAPAPSLAEDFPHFWVVATLRAESNTLVLSFLLFPTSFFSWFNLHLGHLQSQTWCESPCSQPGCGDFHQGPCGTNTHPGTESSEKCLRLGVGGQC